METNEIKKEWTEQVVYVPCSGHDIWCKLYLPLMEEGETLPLVILSHGMDDNYLSCEPYAEKFAARGVAACCLEFYGGGGSMTGGTTSEMSIMTETEELKTVLEAAKGWEFADP